MDIPSKRFFTLTALGVLFSTVSMANGSKSEYISIPGSSKTYTEQQVNDPFSAPDWYPEDHMPLPEIVQFGAKPAAFACASCHLTSGYGHPESASLAGLPVDYQVRQLKAFQRFERPSVAGVMNNIARSMSDKQMRQASEFFASLAPIKVQKVIETDDVPVTFVNMRFMRLIDKDAGNRREPIGERLITVPKDDIRVLARDPYGTFITYVPEGYLTLGKKIVTLGTEKSAACINCHGIDLMGTSLAPPVAGQHASYLVRQLRDYKEGVRRGAADPLAIMANNLKYFTDKEILATSAYIASTERN